MCTFEGFIVGFWLGQQQQQQQQSTDETTTTVQHTTLDHFSVLVDTTIVPFYTLVVLFYLSLRLVVQSSQILIQRRSSSVGVDEDSTLHALETTGTTSVDDGGDESQEQPVNMSGKYKLISIENFDAFLEVQGNKVEHYTFFVLYFLARKGYSFPVNLPAVFPFFLFLYPTTTTTTKH